MSRRAVPGFLALASLVIVGLSWSSSPAAQWTFALLVAAFPPALIWLAVGRRPGRQWLAAVVAGLLVLLQGSTLAILAWRDVLALDRWLLGLPPAGLAFILGLWLAPFVLSTWAHIATFDPSGLRPDDLDELRRRRETPRD
jgi:hypothetical protein